MLPKFTDYTSYGIVKTTILKDSLGKAELHINELANGLVRYVVVLPKKDGIDQHIVFGG